MSYVPEAVYKTSVDWISHHSYEALANFLLWSLDSILQDLVIQQPASKGSKKGGPPPSSKSQVNMINFHFILVSFLSLGLLSMLKYGISGKSNVIFDDEI